jgi:hypothetical protein
MSSDGNKEIVRHVSFSSASLAGVPIDSTLRYSTNSPYELTATFTSPAGPTAVVWSFARDLLFDGLFGDAGYGDVAVRPAQQDADTIDLELRSESGHVVLSASASEIAEFLADTHRLVAPGGESLWFNFDEELHRLVEAG